MSPEIRSRRFKTGASQIRKLYLVLKADRRIQLALALILVGGLLTGLSTQYIPPYVSQQTYTVQLSNYIHHTETTIYPTDGVNLYAEAPNYPIYINVNNSQNVKIYYQVYFINETNPALASLAHHQLIMQGELNSTGTIVIPDTIYHTSYSLQLSAPNNTYFNVPVTITQTVYQYPPANYYMLAPGIMAILFGIVITGASFIRLNSDKERYYSNLNLDSADIDYLFKPSKQLGTIPWIGKIILGFVLAAFGFILFGNGFLLSWFGVVLILAGIAFMLNGIVQKMSTRRY